MSEFRAIETAYAGCRFRSRLEARYAVWFNSLRVEWIYEPEGYLVGPVDRERRYLPDFYLPDLAIWVEVKGSESTVDFTRLADAAHPEWGLPLSLGERNDWPLLKIRTLMLGPVPEVPLFQTSLVVIDGRIVATQMFTPLCESADDHNVDHEHRFTPVLAPLRVEWDEDHNEYSVPPSLLEPWGSGFPCWQIQRAYRDARSARFEHGESGAPNA